jgi:hypothetical protein
MRSRSMESHNCRECGAVIDAADQLGPADDRDSRVACCRWCGSELACEENLPTPLGEVESARLDVPLRS